MFLFSICLFVDYFALLNFVNVVYLVFGAVFFSIKLFSRLFFSIQKLDFPRNCILISVDIYIIIL